MAEEAPIAEKTVPTGPGSATPPEPKKPNAFVKLLRENARVRNALAYGIMVLLLLFVIWTGGIKAAGARTAGQLQGVDALAGAIVPLALERDPVKVERALARIVKEGGYRSMTLTDARGQVLATTDSAMKGQRIADMERASTKAQKSNTPGGPVIRRKVYMAEDNPLGAVEVGLNPE